MVFSRTFLEVDGELKLQQEVIEIRQMLVEESRIV